MKTLLANAFAVVGLQTYGPRISLKFVYTIEDSQHAYVIKVLFSLLDTFRKLG